ncbi:hypothetical protein COS59_01855 [Candidatus Wolfebacteria bacterium CG03_land_8_20_14_0_80_36_15]|uniref:Uncharacterized protein n=1 Tax=Candidatus Wolfebacteria bacterium CG03_land_8_20_14_0_80_36_15 TaxID=1975067 RepID=A0A2M7B7G5_9BACT|nr:MAG: hypothetical protein COS59_01855 [Candidatus Wolfebacteria bacterium CG03_land_8_20_14_0_80_36_15]
MKFEFKINKYYLVGHVMVSKNKPFPAWKKLEEKIWQKYKDEPAYYFLNPKHISWTLETIQIDSSNKNIKGVFLKHISTLEKIYQEIFKSKEFKRLYKETEKYLKFVKRQWQKNKKQALETIQILSGIKLPKKQITVYLTHPKLYNGKAIVEKNIILWGHKEDWQNYSTIYLCHELMHILTWKKQKNYRLMHAIIELLTDEELRIRLNKKGAYFKEKQKLIGHKDLISLKKKILPCWKNYIKGKLGGTIFELEKILIKKGLL